jgi:hypothetical protein
MLKTVQTEDSLQDRVDSAINDVKVVLADYVKENQCDSLPCINNDLDYDGSIHQIIDSSVPVYTKGIKDIWYLHDHELEEAYEAAGCGENPWENNGMAAIYWYIHYKINDWYLENAEQYFQELIAKKV